MPKTLINVFGLPCRQYGYFRAQNQGRGHQRIIAIRNGVVQETTRFDGLIPSTKPYWYATADCD